MVRILVAIIFILCYSLAAQEIKVENPQELAAAIARARPGHVILLKPRDYSLKVAIKTEQNGTEKKPITLRTRGDQDYAVLQMKGTIGFRVQHSHWIIEGIHFQGDPKQTQAVLFLDGSAECSDIQIRDCKISRSSSYGLKTSRTRQRAADRVLIEHTELFDCGRTGFDVIGGDDWVLRRNYVHEFGKAGGISYGIFLKGGGENGLIEGNVVDAGSQNGTIGISFGGGKTGEDWLPHVLGQAIPEHTKGICRNNIVIKTTDVAYHSNNAADCSFLGNLAYGCSGFQRQGSREKDPLLINNLIGKLRGEAEASHHNLGPGQPEWFIDTETMDFRLSSVGSKALRGKAKFSAANPLDLFGEKRSRKRPAPGPLSIPAKSSRRDAKPVWVDRR